MVEKRAFRVPIQHASGGGAYVVIPFDVEEAFGKKRVPVRAWIDGEPYRGTLVRMGSDSHVLIVLKEIRQRIGKGPGDEVEVMLEEDLEPRRVEVPEELSSRLKHDRTAREAFEKLAYTHQREYAGWIREAKRAETRSSRADRALEMLKEGKKLR